MAINDGKHYFYSGAIHMHTTESDGTRSFEEVVAIGREAGLDYMMITDHMTLVHREQGREGIYGNTLVVVGYEHNDIKDHHHYLLFCSPHVYPDEMTVAEYVAAGAADKAIGILAHPDEIRSRLEEYPPYPWTDWTAKGFTGLELWNQMSEWMEKLTPFNKLWMSLSPRKSMVGPTDRILRKWDELNMVSKIVGIAGVDAHAFPVKLGPINIEIFPYKVHFRCLRTVIILDEPMSDNFETASRQFYDAIRECRLFCANIRWGAVDQINFQIDNGDRVAISGGEIELIQGSKLIFGAPSKATLKLIHNGQEIFRKTADNFIHEITKPGIYRVEAWKGRRGWIFTNHIRVYDNNGVS